MTRRLDLVLLGLGIGIVALVAVGLGARPPGAFGSLTRGQTEWYIGCALAAGLFYAAAVWLVRGRTWSASVLPAVVALGLAARLLVLFTPPLLSTDLYRYVWDGRVQAAGINPYRFIPADPALAPLRDEGRGATAIFPNINRADTAPTIYPPAAQALFALIGRTAPSIWGVKAAMLGFDLVAMAACLLLLRAAGRPDAQVLVWAWNPLVIWEFAGGGHIDAAGLAASAVAMLAAAYGRRGWAGAVLGLAVLFKLLPAALFPALWRRWDWRVPVAAAAVILAGYAAYASAGWRVFGYLPGYATEEGLGGSGFLLVRLLQGMVPQSRLVGMAYAGLGLVLLAGLAAFVALRTPWPGTVRGRTLAVARGGLILSGGLIAVLSPHYPWYMTMLVLPMAVVPAWSALWVTVSAPVLYLDHGLDEVVWPVLVFLPALPLLAFDLYPGHAPPADGDP